ncbi:MAG: VCBS repeat-containing protein [Candidatus Aenigmatarchaeota archaeon]|nr:MAG: VCBS repeat-containing protein [Candidatus Aenigmarchaeota archaeon]
MLPKKIIPVIIFAAWTLLYLPWTDALSVNLTTPDNGYVSTSLNLTFGCNATDENLTNITLFVWDEDDGVYYSNTSLISGTLNETNWTVNDTEPGNYKWNCLAYDNESNSAWNGINRTLHVNLFELFQTSVENDDTDSVAVADLDNDGDLDYIAGNYNQPNRIYINDGTGNFSLYESTAESQETYFIAIADLDNDGDMDYIAGNYQQPNNIYLNNGTGNFVLHDNNTGTGSEETRSIIIADLDNDGDLDYAVANMGGSGDPEIQIYKNDGLANFTNFQNITDNPNFYTVAAGDFDDDGDIDMVLGGIPTQLTSIYLNNGSGFFSYDSNLGSSLYSKDMSVMDLNNDGNLDILEATDRNYQNNSVFLNDGTGGFGSADSSFGQTNVTFSAALGDFDNDGFVDIIAGNDGQTNHMYRNDGSANFFDYSLYETISIGTGTRSVASGDIDNDGDLDYIEGNYGNNRIYLNRKNDNNYINVYIFSSTSSVSRDAVGTKVEVADTNGTLRGFREVTASDSSKNGPPQLHFGLTSGVTYTINATFITGDAVSCTVQAPKEFTFYENASATNGVSCFLFDPQPQITTMTPENGNVTRSIDVNFTCAATDNENLVSMTLYVWDSNNEIYNQSTTSVSGTSNQSSWVVETMTPGTYFWNCRICDNAPQCVFQSTNYTLGVLVTSRITIKLVINNTDGYLYIPGRGEVSASIVDYYHANPPNYYLASYFNNAVKALVFSNRIPRMIAADTEGAGHYISLQQDIENSVIFLAFTLGDWTVVQRRIEMIEKGRFMDNPVPSFSYGLGKKYSTDLSLYYDNIDLQGRLRFGRGSHNIIIENNGTLAGKPMIRIE